MINGSLIRNYGIDGQGLIRPRLVEKSILHTRMNALGGAKMPPLAKNRIDAEAARVLSEWIHSLDPDAFPDNALPAAENYPPFARSDIAYISPAPRQTAITALANDQDPEGKLDPGSLAIITSPLGSASIAASGFLYDPTDPVAPDSFTYQIADDSGLVSNEARVTIEIRPDHLNWLGRNFSEAEQSDPEIGSWIADPDGDGSNNLMEYARGTDPMSRASVPRIDPVVEILDGQDFHSLTISKAPDADIVWTIEASDDLANWHSAEVVTDSRSTLTARTPISGGRSYLRVKVLLIE